MPKPQHKLTLDTRPRVEGVGRYVICPGTEHMHTEPVALEIYPSSNRGKPCALCDCGTRVWLSERASLADLLAFDDLAAAGLELNQRTPLMAPLVPGDGERFVFCPLSGRMHPGYHALVVQYGKLRKDGKWKGQPYAYAVCGTCTTRSFMGPRWVRGMGLTLEQVQARGMTVSC